MFHKYFYLFITLFISFPISAEYFHDACDFWGINNDHIVVKTEATKAKLEVPWPSHITKKVSKTGSCEYIQSLSITYGWYDGKIHSLPETKKIFDNKSAFPVKVYFKGDYFFDELLKTRKPIETWRFDFPVSHDNFPLELYPKYYWVDPSNMPEDLSSKLNARSRWGVVDTKNKSPLHGLPFTTSCSIAIEKVDDFNNKIKNKFIKYADSKCRGSISFKKGNKIFWFMVDIWAFKGDYQNDHPISHINTIYDALIDELRSYIQE